MGRRAEKEFEEWALDAEAYTIEDVAKRAADKALYAQDAVAETPDQGTISGRDQIAAYLGEFGAVFPDASWEEL